MLLMRSSILFWRNYLRFYRDPIELCILSLRFLLQHFFLQVRNYIEKKVRKFVMKRKKLKGFGWQRWSREDIYQKWGLYNDYRIEYIRPKAASAR